MIIWCGYWATSIPKNTNIENARDFVAAHTNFYKDQNNTISLADHWDFSSPWYHASKELVLQSILSRACPNKKYFLIESYNIDCNNMLKFFNGKKIKATEAHYYKYDPISNKVFLIGSLTVSPACVF